MFLHMDASDELPRVSFLNKKSLRRKTNRISLPRGPVQDQKFTSRANSSRFWLTLLFHLAGFGWLWPALTAHGWLWLRRLWLDLVGLFWVAGMWLAMGALLALILNFLCWASCWYHNS